MRKENIEEQEKMQKPEAPHKATLEAVTLKASTSIRGALKAKDYESVCLQVGKYLENLLGRIEGSSIGRASVVSRLDGALSRREIRPLLVHNLKAAWELRHIAAHNIHWVFRREHAMTSIIALNGAIRWFFGPYQTQQQTKYLSTVPAKKLKGVRPCFQSTYGRKALGEADIVDTATAQRYFNDWFDGRTALDGIMRSTAALLTAKGVLDPDNNRIDAFQQALVAFLIEKGESPKESTLFRAIDTYFRYRNRKVTFNRPITAPALNELLWFLGLETTELIDGFKLLLDPPDKAFIHQVTIAL